MTIGNTDAGTSITAQYNPTKVAIALATMWTKAAIPGQSYQEQQYSGTGNPTITFELAFDGRSDSLKKTLKEIENYLFALQYPALSPGSVSGGAPPRIIFSWPKWVLLVATMPKFTQTTTRWEPDGTPSYQTYSVELEQRLTRRIGNEEVARNALRRSS